jgi:predicted site-specific integrase-resolvase
VSGPATLSTPAVQLLSRGQLSERWGVCTETLKRREKAGHLPCVVLGSRLKRYRLRDIEAIESEALCGGGGAK